MSEKHTQVLALGLEKICSENEFCDFVIKSDSVEYPCHKVVLAAVSDFFKTMFSSGMQEEVMGMMAFGGPDELCRTFLKFIYTGSCELTTDNVEAMFQLGLQYRIPTLETFCLQFLNENLQTVNCVKVWEISKLISMTDLEERSRSLILKDFLQLYDSEDFLCLSKVELVTSLLSEKNLNCLDKTKVCKAGLGWIEWDFENREEYIGDLLNTFLSIGILRSQIEDVIGEFQELFRSPKCTSELESIFSKKEKMNEHDGFSKTDESLIIIGGSEGGSNQSVICFSFRRKKWYSLAPVPRDPGYNFALCGSGTNLYLSGGSGGKMSFWCYSAIENRWRECQPMPVTRQYHCTAAKGGKVFLLGGIEKQGARPIEEIDVYDAQSSSWLKGKHAFLSKPVRSSTCIVQGDKVFLFGGIDHYGNQSEFVQYYDIKLNMTTFLRYSLPKEARLQSRAVSLDNNVYVISKSGSVFRCNEQDDGKVFPVGKIENGKFPRQGFGACVFEDKILILGGDVNFQNRNDMLQYNVVNSNLVEMQEKLPISLQGFCSVKLDVMWQHFQMECGSGVMLY